MTDKEINELPALLTVMEMAKVLRIGRSAAYELVCKKNFPILRLGPKKIRIPKVKLIEWIKNNSKENKEENLI